MRTLIIVTLLLSISPNPLTATAASHPQAPQTKPKALHLVQKIYVEELGTSDEAERFYLLLQDKLTKNGFVVVDESDDADGVLSGVLTVLPVNIYGGEPDIRITLQLKSPNDERLWTGNSNKSLYGALGGFVLLPGVSRYKEPIEFRADEIANKLRADWKKSAEAAGIKLTKQRFA